MPRSAIDSLRESVRGRSLLNVRMADQTTLRVGGPADLLVYPADREDLGTLLALLGERGISHFVLGGGSNLLVRDGGIRDAVVSLAEGFGTVERRENRPDRVVFWADAGVPLRRLIRWAVEEGISALEPLAGIPGTLGGALAMNAGAWGLEIADRVLGVEVLDAAGAVQRLARSDLRFGYRAAELPEKSIVLGALLWGEPRESEEIRARVRDFLDRRRDRQPMGEPSAGSVFKNPPGHSAGRLIEECGLKGVRVGDAEVSRLHANFIVNTGRAKASHVVALMEMMQERVYVRHKIRLEPEIRVVGEWDKGKLRIQE